MRAMRAWIVLLLLSSCSRGPSAPVITNKQAAPAAPPCDGPVCVLPDVTLTTDANLDHSRADLANDVVIVHFWATWAKTSAADFATLTNAWERFRERNVVVFGIFTSEDSEAQLRDFLLDHPIQYPLVRATPAIMSAYNYPDKIPTTFVFGRGGARVMHHVGALEEEALMSLLEQVTR
jgi:peroxiredoxin